MLEKLIEKQQALIDKFFSELDPGIVEKAVLKINSCQGILFFCGVGKSGWVAKKLAATLTSIGKRAFFLDPLDALHGDIGAVRKNDLVIFLSKSGKTAELLEIMPHIRKTGACIQAWVCEKGTDLGDEIHLPLENELCPYNLAPLTSPSVQMLFGDIVAAALLQEMPLSDYSKNHPAGNIGKRAQLLVHELMLHGKKLPYCDDKSLVGDTLEKITQKGSGCLVVVNEKLEAIGMITDGDLRRALQKRGDQVLREKVTELMTKDFISVQSTVEAVLAKKIMQERDDRWVSVLPVLDGKKLVGIIRMHDLVNL